MNPIISDLIKELEASRHPVCTKAYVLKRLRESQRLDCPNCVQIPVYTMDSFPRPPQDVKGGDQNRNLSENDRRSS